MYLGLGKVNEICKHTGKLRRKGVLFCLFIYLFFWQKRLEILAKNGTINENMLKRVQSVLYAEGSVSGKVWEDLGQCVTG